MSKQKFDDVSDDDDELVSRAPSAALAREMLREAMPPAVRRAISDQTPTLVVLTASGAGCVKWLGITAKRVCACASVISVPSAPKPSASSQFEMNLLLPTIVITGDASWVPSEIIAAQDHSATLRLTPRVVACAIAAYCRSSPPRLTAADLVGLQFEDVAFAIRHGDRAVDCVARLRRTRARRSAHGRPASAPPLERLSGFGPALDEIKAIAADVRRQHGRGERSPSILLYGPPGTGKTMLAGSLAQSVSLPMVRTSVADWFVGDGHLGAVVTKADEFFRSAEAHGACVAFLDEIEAIPDRSGLRDEHRAWWTTIATGILTMIDRTRAAAPGVLLVAATNHYERLDAAVKRPGRFDRHIQILGPRSPDDASDILRFHLGEALDADALAAAGAIASAQEMTGAAIEAAVRAARSNARAAGRPVELADLVRLLAPSNERDAVRRRSTAIHEAGHAIVAHAIGLKVDVVSIVASGKALGFTRYADGAFVENSRAAIEAHVIAGLAGRAADELLSGGAAAGAVADLRFATHLIAALHACYGLGDTLASRGDLERAETLLDCDPGLARLVEDELQRLMTVSRDLVARHRGAILALAERLSARRVVAASEVAEMFDASMRDHGIGAMRDSRQATAPAHEACANPQIE
ncbi:AAA family ATPase [Methylopila turkensis]|uniref:AAA+ ATPase domain-containing protein n=1 Tax=Methylopila turkensis TaxID=1437816 RepID=A0A9W6JMX0_9HYPH|nr:AAA family ATPase [Methylopila turkensis]GLK80117.1 hypothetical protein GCM10008174_18580 [Methylopila turkensis]